LKEQEEKEDASESAMFSVNESNNGVKYHIRTRDFRFFIMTGIRHVQKPVTLWRSKRRKKASSWRPISFCYGIG